MTILLNLLQGGLSTSRIQQHGVRWPMWCVRRNATSDSSHDGKAVSSCTSCGNAGTGGRQMSSIVSQLLYCQLRLLTAMIHCKSSRLICIADEYYESLEISIECCCPNLQMTLCYITASHCSCSCKLAAHAVAHKLLQPSQNTLHAFRDGQ